MEETMQTQQSEANVSVDDQLDSVFTASVVDTPEWDADILGVISDARLQKGSTTENIDERLEVLEEDITSDLGIKDEFSASEYTITLEVDLPNGDSFETTFNAPQETGESEIMTLAEELGIVIGAGDSFARNPVPVERINRNYYIDMMEIKQSQNNNEQTDQRETETDGNEAEQFLGIGVIGMMGFVLLMVVAAAPSIPADDGTIILTSIGWFVVGCYITYRTVF